MLLFYLFFNEAVHGFRCAVDFSSTDRGLKIGIAISFFFF